MADFEFLFMLALFGGAFVFFVYLLAMAIWEMVTNADARRAAAEDARRNAGENIFSLICILFVLLLFGSLTLSMLGLPSPIHFKV